MKYRIKALTLRHPWLWMIKHAGKNIENRSWQPYTAPTHIALHGGSYNGSNNYILEIQSSFIWASLNVPGFEEIYQQSNPVQGKILTGIHAIVPWRGVVPRGVKASPWHDPFQFGWKLEDIIWLPEPIQCKGAQGLWNLPETIDLELQHLIANHKPTPRETAAVIAKSDLFGVLP
jgi:hypothetical protein